MGGEKGGAEVGGEGGGGMGEMENVYKMAHGKKGSDGDAVFMGLSYRHANVHQHGVEPQWFFAQFFHRLQGAMCVRRRARRCGGVRGAVLYQCARDVTRCKRNHDKGQKTS